MISQKGSRHSENLLDIIIDIGYNNITEMNLIHQGWSKDLGPPNGGEFPRHFYLDEEYVWQIRY